MSVSQIIIFIFVVPKHRCGQQRLKEQCVMVLANLDRFRFHLGQVVMNS